MNITIDNENLITDIKFLVDVEKRLEELADYSPNPNRCLMLTKEQSFKYFIDKGMSSRYVSKHNVTSAVRGKCLGCGKEIFIPFDATSTRFAYCDACQTLVGTFPDKELPHLMRYKSMQLALTELNLGHSPEYVRQVLEDIDVKADECNVLETIKDKAWIELRTMKKAKAVNISKDAVQHIDIKNSKNGKFEINKLIVNKISI